jgi:hypothetical protein
VTSIVLPLNIWLLPASFSILLAAYLMFLYRDTLPTRESICRTMVRFGDGKLYLLRQLIFRCGMSFDLGRKEKRERRI